jgi:hypothetical protein
MSDNNTMHAKPDLRVFEKWMIDRSGSVIAAVRRLETYLVSKNGKSQSLTDHSSG